MINERGVTLLEILLVLAIASFIIVMGIQRFDSYRREMDLEQIKNNVDELFRAATYFYQANCRAKPFYPNQQTVYNIKIDTELFPSYIKKWPFTFNQFVDDKDKKGYSVQFNKYTHTRNIYVCNSYWTPACSNPPEPIRLANSVMLWTIQVAVKVKNPELVNFYRGILGADCISVVDGEGVKACDTIPLKKGEYIVWERLPSFASPNTSSDLWPSMIVSKQFNKDYTNDEYYAYILNDPNYNHDTAYEDYLCGS